MSLTTHHVVHVQLADSGTNYLAKPMSLSIEKDGDFIITDDFFQRIYRYSRGGQLLAIAGKRGHGPGEFEMIGAAVVLDDSLLAVLDDSRKSVTFLRLRDGSYLKEAHYGGTASTFASSRGDTLTFGLQNVGTRTGLAQLVFPDTTFRYFASLPEARIKVQALGGIHTLVAHDEGPTSTIVGFSGVDSLFEITSSGTVLRSYSVPVRHRRHLARPSAEYFGKPRPFSEFFAAVSFLFGVKELQGGEIAVLHMDQDIDGRLITSKPFLSILSRDRKRGCFDTTVPVSSDARLVPQFSGDTLFFVTQRVQGTRVDTFVEGFAVDVARCRWEGTG